MGNEELYTPLMTGEGLVGLGLELNKLETLNLERNSYLTNKGLTELIRIAGSNLKSLNLNCTIITGEGFTGSSLQLYNLETLSMKWCSKLTDRGLSELFRITGPQLKTLDLTSSRMTGEGLRGLSLGLNKLETLILTDSYFTDRGLSELLRLTGLMELTKLETLDLDFCISITDRGLCNLLTICGLQLQSLNLNGTLISGAVLADWIEDHPLERLKKLEINFCNYVNNSDVQRMSDLLSEMCQISDDIVIEDLSEYYSDDSDSDTDKSDSDTDG